jgi:hypothetical protein
MITVEDLKRLDAIGEPIISTYMLADRWNTSRGYLANRRLVGDSPTFFKDGKFIYYDTESVHSYEKERVERYDSKRNREAQGR